MTPCIDLRSDTVTKPSGEMREFMMNAEVGDDVFGEDPTVNLLQQEMAHIVGKEAGLFVPSGVMGNQLAIASQTLPGDEVIVERDSHIFLYETAAPSVWSSVQLMPVKGKHGVLDPEDVVSSVRPGAYYFPRTALVVIENTHNQAGGIIYPIEELRKLRKDTMSLGLKLHIDGARIWNASVETGISVSEYASHADSITVCFSKGLGAPVGSMLLGDSECISKAHRFRKVFGGGMRQVGILAGACLFAIRNNIPRLKHDHLKAQKFARALSSVPGVIVDLEHVETNIILCDVKETGHAADDIMNALKDAGVKLIAVSPTLLRAVTHMNVSGEEIDTAAEIIGNVVQHLMKN